MEYIDNLQTEKEGGDFNLQMEEWDHKAKVIVEDVPKEKLDSDTEKFNTASFKS